MGVTAKNSHAFKWTVLSFLDKKSTDTGLAFILKTEKIDGQNPAVMLEDYPAVGYVYAQYFRAKNLANKYSNHHFKNMTYSKI